LDSGEASETLQELIKIANELREGKTAKWAALKLNLRKHLHQLK
jgi:hypothetical protein